MKWAKNEKSQTRLASLTYEIATNISLLHKENTKPLEQNVLLTVSYISLTKQELLAAFVFNACTVMKGVCFV